MSVDYEAQLRQDVENIFHDIRGGIMNYEDGIEAVIETIKEVIEELVSTSSMRERETPEKKQLTLNGAKAEKVKI